MNLPSSKYQWLNILYNLVLELKPNQIIEIGTGNCSTTITMGLALKELNMGQIYSYDLFDSDYWGSIERCLENLKTWNVDDVIQLQQMDFYDWIKISPSDRKFDLLYFDINNDGTKLNDLYTAIRDDIEGGSVVIFEGGSLMRDDVPWMSDKRKMNDVKSEIGYDLLTENTKYSASIIYNKKMYELDVNNIE